MNEETPWAAVQRLKGEGATLETIVQTLRERGLADDDLDALLQQEPGYGELRREVREATTPPPATTPPLPVGAWLTWAALVLLALLAGVALGGGWWMIGALISAPMFALTAFELRKGLLVTARKLGFTFFFGFLPSVLGGFIVGWHPPQLAGSALFLSSFGLLWVASRAQEALRHVDGYGSGTVFETNGVQFNALVGNAEPLAPGEFLVTRIVAQNVLTAPRRLELRLAGDSRSGLTEPLVLSADLPPGDIVALVLPLRLGPIAVEWFNLTLGVSAIGTEPGRRLRVIEGERWVTSAESIATNVLGVLTLTTVGAGVFRLGSNGRIHVRVKASETVVEPERWWESSTTTLWTPDPEDLRRAVRR